MKTIRPTLSDTAPLTHSLNGFHEVLVPEDVLEWYREHPLYLGRLMLDCIDENLCPFFMTPLYEEEADDGQEE